MGSKVGAEDSDGDTKQWGLGQERAGMRNQENSGKLKLINSLR